VPLPLIALVSAALAVPGPVRHEELLVFAAASLTDALQDAGERWGRESRFRVAFNFAGSSTLERQIEAGAPADLFVSADAAKVDALERAGLLEPGTRHTLFSNRLVVVVAAVKGAPVSELADLAKPGVESLAIAQPDSVPAGIYARELLQSAGLWDAVRAKVIPTENVRAALAAVASGDADAAIVYSTDVEISRRVRVAVTVDPSAGPQIAYVAAVPVSAPHSVLARRFLAWFATDEARQLFARHGFLVLPGAAD